VNSFMQNGLLAQGGKPDPDLWRERWPEVRAPAGRTHYPY
jgi:hypothetical protein